MQRFGWGTGDAECGVDLLCSSTLRCNTSDPATHLALPLAVCIASASQVQE